jgi:pimeloyl-ACP methyl ester carboxylesterase
MTNIIRRRRYVDHATHGSSNPSHEESTIHFRCAVDTLLDAIPTLGEFPYPYSSSCDATSRLPYDLHNDPTIEHTASAHTDRPKQLANPTWSGPTQFISGSDSSYIRSDNIDSTLAFFPKSMLKVIAKAGHWVHADQPDETVREIVDFVREVR